MLAPYPQTVEVAICDAPDCKSWLLIPQEPPSGALPVTVLRLLYRWTIEADGRTFCRDHSEPSSPVPDDEWWTTLREDQLAAAEPLPWDGETSIPLPPGVNGGRRFSGSLSDPFGPNR